MNGIRGESINLSWLPSVPMLCCAGIVADLAGVGIFPAVPAIQSAFNIGSSGVDAAVGPFMLSAGIFQPFVGLLADRWGRRPVLTGSIALLCLSSILSIFSDSLLLFMIARAGQGIGASAMFIVPRAIARDTHDDSGTTKIVGVIVVCVAAAGVVGPPFFGFIIERIGWQSLFMVLAVLSGLLFLWTLQALRETAVATHEAVNIAAVFADIIQIGRNTAFLGHTLVLTSATAAYFVFLSFFAVVDHEGRTFSPLVTGNIIGLLSISFIAGAILGGATTRWIAMMSGLRWAVGAIIICAACQIGVVLLKDAPEAVFFLPTIGFAFALGVLNPLTISGAMGNIPSLAGAASGLSTSISLVGTSLTISAAGRVMGNSALGLAISMAVISLPCLFGLYLLERRSPQRQSTPAPSDQIG